MTDKKNLFCVLTSTVFVITLLSGCASTPKSVDKPIYKHINKSIDNPLVEKSWRVIYNNKVPTSKEEIVKELLDRAQPTDSGEKSKLLELADSYFPSNLDGTLLRPHISCKDIQNKLLSFIDEKLTVPVHITLLKPGRTFKSLDTRHDDGAFTKIYILEVSWDGGPWRRRGDVYLTYALESLECLETDIAAASIKVINPVIGNPETNLGEEMATMEILWEDVQKGLDELVEAADAVGRNEYMRNINAILENFDKKANYYRYAVETPKVIKFERRYQIEPKIIISRIQRTIDAFKFDEANSRFTFSSGIIEVIKSRKQNISSDFDLSASIFPESNGSSAIVYEVKFKPVSDTFTGKTIFTEKDILNHVEDYIAKIEKAIK